MDPNLTQMKLMIQFHVVLVCCDRGAGLHGLCRFWALCTWPSSLWWWIMLIMHGPEKGVTKKCLSLLFSLLLSRTQPRALCTFIFVFLINSSYPYLHFTFTFMHLADAFIQSDLHCIQVTVSTFYQLLLSLGIEPIILALLAPCSTS